MRSVKVQWVVGFKQKQWLSDEFFRNILQIQTYNWTKYALCESTLRGGLQGEAMAFRSNFLMIIHIQTYNWKIMSSVKVTWVVGFKQKQWLLEEVFQNIIHIQTYNWTKHAPWESTVGDGLQSEAMAFRRSFSKHYTHSNIQLDKECALWKYSGWWASSRSNGFQKKFFKTLYTFKHTIEQSMRPGKVQWVMGFNQKQWLSEEVFRNIIHIQTYNWTKYALCESPVSGGLQAEARASRRSFSKHYSHSNIQLNKVCALWKYTEWWASSRKKWVSEVVFWNIIHIQTNNWKKCELCQSDLRAGLQAEKIGFQKKFFKTLDTFKHTIEQSMCSVKVHWVVGFKQKQWFSEKVFQNNIHIQTYSWTKYALCESTLSGRLQAEAMSFRTSFQKHYTHSNIQLIKVCARWNYTEWWASNRSNGFQKKFSKTLYTFKHTIEQSMPSLKLHWVVGFKQKQ